MIQARRRHGRHGRCERLAEVTVKASPMQQAWDGETNRQAIATPEKLADA
jgi:hypothetical protein